MIVSPTAKVAGAESGGTVADYFTAFPGLESGDEYNGAGFWELPVPVVNHLDVHDRDVVVWDEQGCGRTIMMRAGANAGLCFAST